MPDNNSMGLEYAINLLDQFKMQGRHREALETLKAAALAQQNTTHVSGNKLDF